MVIKLVYNNVALATDEGGREVVVIGRGVCFGRRAGDAVDASLVEKVFSLQGQDNVSRLERLLKSISPAGP